MVVVVVIVVVVVVVVVVAILVKPFWLNTLPAMSIISFAPKVTAWLEASPYTLGNVYFIFLHHNELHG